MDEHFFSIHAHLPLCANIAAFPVAEALAILWWGARDKETVKDKYKTFKFEMFYGLLS